VEITDVSGVSPGLFITGIIFILLVGSLLSLGVLRFFQQKKRQGTFYFIGSVVSFVVMVLVVNRWFA
jgi:hypothetical protein